MPRLVGRLSKVAGRRDLLVIGLTQSTRSAVDRVLRNLEISFAVGYGSRSDRDFGIKRTPAMILVKRGAKLTTSEISSEELDTFVPEWMSPEASAAQFTDEWELRQFVEGPGDSLERRQAVKLLYDKLPPDEFIQLADELIESESNPDVRCRAMYWKRVAQGEDLEYQVLAPSMSYEQQLQAAPNDPAWREISSFPLESLKNPEVALETYAAHMSEAPADVLLRKRCVEIFTSISDKPAIRAAMMRLLPLEPDFGIRGLLTSALVQSCEVGDLEAADLLSKLAESEDNLYHVRPWMENSAIYLRTGLLNVNSQNSTSP